MIDPKIVQREAFLLAGNFRQMSFIEDQTATLWHSFMPKRNQIPHRTDALLYSLQQYAPNWSYAELNPKAIFTKWAAVEVSTKGTLPPDMSFLHLSGGLYAVFRHIGPAHTFPKTAHQIFVEWMPQSGYTTDDRPHFEVLQEGYNPQDPLAEEDLWIPIRSLV
ncbi:MAG: GyrI-like domain-containing protein [Rhodothermia bacterium]|nr:GyrI-like domain-containing protein [Rhodothermia bacterium]